MSKRKILDVRCGDSDAKRTKQAKRHLYLLLDDWERGYSVRRYRPAVAEAFHRAASRPH